MHNPWQSFPLFALHCAPVEVSCTRQTKIKLPKRSTASSATACLPSPFFYPHNYTHSPRQQPVVNWSCRTWPTNVRLANPIPIPIWAAAATCRAAAAALVSVCRMGSSATVQVAVAQLSLLLLLPESSLYGHLWVSLRDSAALSLLTGPQSLAAPATLRCQFP